MGRAMRSFLLSSAFSAVLVFGAHADCPGEPDGMAFTTDLAFCWREADGNRHASCKIEDQEVKCGPGGHPDHQWYVEAITNAYIRGQTGDLVAIFNECERDNSDARERADRCSLAQHRKAAAHVISCYQPVRHGAFIGYGAKPDWSEAEKAGLKECQH
jgi:hypothetical protein